MIQTIIGNHIRRINRNRVILGVSLIAAALAICGLNSRYVDNFVQGPDPIKREALFAIGDPAAIQRNFVSIRGDDVNPSGITEVEEDSNTTTADLQVMQMGQRLLLVKAPPGNKSLNLTGELTEIPPDVREKFIEPLETKEPKVAAAFLPFMLDTKDYRGEGYLGLAAVVALIAFGLWNLNLARRFSENIKSSPAAASLARYGDPEDMAYRIDSDFKAEVKAFGRAQVSSEWLLWATKFNVTVQRLDDLVWVYKQTTQHRTNFVPTGKTYAVILYDRSGATSKIELSLKHTDSLLEWVAEKRPWVLQGFTKEVAAAWVANSAAVIATVDERRQQLRSPSPGPADRALV